MTDHNDRLHEASLRLAGMLGLRHAMNLPEIVFVYIGQQHETSAGRVRIEVRTRADVDRFASVLGLGGAPRFDTINALVGSYIREDEHWRISCDEHAPFEPLPVVDDAETMAGGSTFGLGYVAPFGGE